MLFSPQFGGGMMEKNYINTLLLFVNNFFSILLKNFKIFLTSPNITNEVEADK